MSETPSNLAELAPQQRHDCAVLADLLASAGRWDIVVLGSVLLGGWALAQGPMPGALFAGLGLLLAERYLAVRLSLDQRLFERLALGSLPGLAALDGSLTRLFALPEAKAGRLLAARFAGTRRLWRLHLASVLALAALAAVALARMP
ncbi:hypothetical protein OOT46_06655 [Aquabacterium sp. A7-Y]|uniref:hypothetical protein n=1 Tax=Aquabacterium sp. A7-Y TaxID=1349605 RepID=UPI00223E7571|nr:hypothetical protein [Aquabacterium sp. A7-Y]MCW7537531.1 hypothetical protein [Aquabacterium sp. A7-Y]